MGVSVFESQSPLTKPMCGVTIADLVPRATGITCDSAAVEPGFLFVAIRGRVTDGNLYAAEAARRGAVAIVTDSPSHVVRLDIPVIAVSDARRALSELAASVYGNPSRALHVTGITGSNGKTTFTFMLEAILRQANRKAGLIGTVRIDTGARSLQSKLTTPDAADLQRALNEMRNNHVTDVAMEVSAQGIDMKRVEHVHFACGVFSNICPDHLDFHGDFPTYVAAKRDFLRILEKSSAPLITNINDRLGLAFARDFRGRVISCGIETAADVTASPLQMSSTGSRFLFEILKPLATLHGYRVAPGRIELTVPLPGRHNIENALLAATAALLHGVPSSAFAKGLETFQAVDRRMNVMHHQGLTIVDDTALNPGSIDAVFAALDLFRYRKLVAVYAIRGKRGVAINEANAAALARQWLKAPFEFFVTSSVDGVGTADRVSAQEQRAFTSALDNVNVKYVFDDSLPASLSNALATVGPDDLLLLIGAQGMDGGRSIVMNALGRHQPEPDFVRTGCGLPNDAAGGFL
jgi:UDP-N-acetylmuramoyl-L-alanyl-D-glutamate--2,6-diaminopimelate ligase